MVACGLLLCTADTRPGRSALSTVLITEWETEYSLTLTSFIRTALWYRAADKQPDCWWEISIQIWNANQGETWIEFTDAELTGELNTMNSNDGAELLPLLSNNALLNIMLLYQFQIFWIAELRSAILWNTNVTKWVSESQFCKIITFSYPVEFAILFIWGVAHQLYRPIRL